MVNPISKITKIGMDGLFYLIGYVMPTIAMYHLSYAFCMIVL